MTEWQNFRISKRRDFMKHRRTFMWMGLLVLFLVICIQSQAFCAQKYRVKKGDTLVKIAKKYGVSVESLKKANRLQSSALHLKQDLVIPGSKEKIHKNRKVIASSSGKKKTNVSYYKVKKGDTLSSIAKRKGVSIADLKAMNHLKGSTLKAGCKLVIARAEMKDPESELPRPDALTNPASPDVRSLEEDLSPISDQEWEEISREQRKSGVFLGKWRSFKERQLLVKVALGFIGAPYRSGGDTIRGLDSSGFVQKIYEIFDVALPRTALEQSRLGKRVDRTDLQEGDLVFFHDHRAAGVVGIYIGNNKFVHASPDGNREVQVGYLNEPSFEKHFIKAVRLKDLEGEA